MIKQLWRVRFTRSDLPMPTRPLPFVADLPDGWPDWLRESGLVAGTPFLVSPTLEFDVVLNSFFRDVVMAGRSRSTQDGYARDLAGFLTFLWVARERRGWRDATEADHLAYLHWRRHDPDGPRVAGATWDREVAAVNCFYRWAVRCGHVASNPIPQVSRRPGPVEAGWGGRRTLDEQRPATYAHDGASGRIEWLPPATYRRWRDVGVRGFSAEGLPRDGFRGRWAGRNAAFCDLMVRTGLRLAEQSALTVLEVPLERGAGGYRRFWLPQAIAKGRSARWVYVPGSVVADVGGYVRWDRAEAVTAAREAGRYRRWQRPWVVEDPARLVACRVGDASAVKVAHLDAVDRRRLLVNGPDGLQPAWLWLGERGEPLSLSAWKEMFRDSNARCAAAGVGVWCHAHLLRHTFAVVTLEQLQRGHIAALAELVQAQREHYVRIFGDPLDWVRRRLGHRSVVTTQVYLHALAELEMQTRMALVPDGWENPRQMPLADLVAAGADDAGVDVDDERGSSW